jgi:hypothetical protein
VAFSEWLTELRKVVLEDTLDKIEKEGDCGEKKDETIHS